MLIAIPTTGDSLDSALDPRFGRALMFAIVDSETGESVEVITNPNVAAGGGVGLTTSQMLANRGVKAVIAGAVGPNALSVLQAAGIAIYSSAGLSSVKEVIESFKSGNLQAITTPGAAGRYK